jgi:hypothetical protein
MSAGINGLGILLDVHYFAAVIKTALWANSVWQTRFLAIWARRSLWRPQRIMGTALTSSRFRMSSFWIWHCKLLLKNTRKAFSLGLHQQNASRVVSVQILKRTPAWIYLCLLAATILNPISVSATLWAQPFTFVGAEEPGRKSEKNLFSHKFVNTNQISLKKRVVQFIVGYFVGAFILDRPNGRVSYVNVRVKHDLDALKTPVTIYLDAGVQISLYPDLISVPDSLDMNFRTLQQSRPFITKGKLISPINVVKASPGFSKFLNVNVHYYRHLIEATPASKLRAKGVIIAV